MELAEVISIEGARTRIQELREREDGWDGREAPALSNTAVDIGYQVLEMISEKEMPLSRVVPDVMGGIALYFFQEGKRCDISIDNDGSIVAGYKDHTSGKFDCGEIDLSEIPKELDKIRKYMS